jgi:CRISPR-associated protein Cas2
LKFRDFVENPFTRREKAQLQNLRVGLGKHPGKLKRERLAMSQYIAAYDVSSDQARDKVARMLTEYGQRLQWSVFLVWIEPDELPDLRRELGTVLARDDRFDLLPIDGAATRQRWCWQRPPDSFTPVILA